MYLCRSSFLNWMLSVTETLYHYQSEESEALEKSLER